MSPGTKQHTATLKIIALLEFFLNLPPSLILRENNSFYSVNCHYNKELCTKISSPLIEIECFSREEEN